MNANLTLQVDFIRLSLIES